MYIMDWFNLWDLIFIAITMISNIIFAIKCKDGFENKYSNKVMEIIEQISRFGCFVFMSINIYGKLNYNTIYNLWSD